RPRRTAPSPPPPTKPPPHERFGQRLGSAGRHVNPVLTERLTLPPLEFDTTLPQEPKARPGGAPLPLDTSLPSNFPPKAAPAPAKAAAPAPARPAPSPVPAPAAARPAPAPATAPPARATAPAESSTTQHWTRIELEL